MPVVKSGTKHRINGFNSSKIYHTNVYKVNLTVGGEEFVVEAIGRPEITINLNIPGLSEVAAGFLEKGYTLADQSLTVDQDCITDIEFILGSCSAYCLKERHIGYGEVENNIPSVYSETIAGVMLVGNVDQMKSNLIHLPPSPPPQVNIYCSEVEKDSQAKTDVTYENIGLNRHSYAESFEQDHQVVAAGFVTFDKDEEIGEVKFQNVAKNMLEKICCETLNFDTENYPDESVEKNEEIINYVLKNTTRNEEGKLVMPLIWNNKVSHLLAKNRNLAVQILRANFKNSLRTIHWV